MKNRKKPKSDAAPAIGYRLFTLRNMPRRHVCGWEWDCFWGWSNRVRSISWPCRSCARLRYSSEGCALVLRGGDG